MLVRAQLVVSTNGRIVSRTARVVQLRGVASAEHARENAHEMAHRRLLLVLFVVRPATRELARSLLQAGASRTRVALPRVAGWCAAALELVATLDSAVWARYFRTNEVLQLGGGGRVVALAAAAAGEDDGDEQAE